MIVIPNLRGILSKPSIEIPFSGLSLWVSADYGVTVGMGGNISGVLDKSAAANNLVYSSGNPTLSVNIINGKPAFYFFGGRLEGSDIVTAKTIYAVVKTETVTLPFQYSNILECTGGGIYSAILTDSWGSYFSGETPSGNAFAADTAYVIASISDDGITYSFRENGLEIISGSDGNGFYPRSTLYFGNDSSNGQPAKCYVAELIVYNRVITEEECLQIESYLNAKYNIY